MTNATYQWRILQVPILGKLLHEWQKILSFVFLLGSWFGSFLLGKEKGYLLGWLCAVAFVVLWLAFFLLDLHRGKLASAIEVLDKSSSKADERRNAAKGLRSANWQSIVALIVLGLASIGCALLAFFDPIYRVVSTEQPKDLQFASIQYYDPTAHLTRSEEAPFLEAIIGFLKNEGASEGRAFQIVLGETKPFAHPTPEFRCTLVVDQGNVEVTGYAFRRRPGQSPAMFQPVQADYSKEGQVVFTVPPSDKGDLIFLVARFSIVKGRDFPSSLKDLSHLRVLEEVKP